MGAGGSCYPLGGRKTPMEFRYFRGPEDDMGLLPYIRTCSLCGQPSRCFDLTNLAVPGQAERQGKIGCYDCLRRGRFGFNHDTEVGMITEDGLVAYFEPSDEPRHVFVVASDGEAVAEGMQLISLPQPKISAEAAAELRRTPSFSTWQDIPWAVHCGDFMAYVEHKDAPSVVVFECLHCGATTEVDDPD